MINKENLEIEVRKGLKLKKGDIIFITINSKDKDKLAKGRFVGLTKEGNVKLYVIDPKFNLVDIEISPERVIKRESPN